MSKKCTCGISPTIILPGIGQSKVELYENGKKKMMAWPLDIDTKAFVKKMLPSTLMTIIFRQDVGFISKLKRTLAETFEPLRNNPDGTSPHDLRIVKYNQSFAKCNDEEIGFIYRMVPMQDIARDVGEDHLYFFSYHSFGRPYDTADDLDKFIQQVKEETGHDKVNLISISLGGSLTVAYLDKYGEKNDIDKIIGIVPAFGGTYFASDLMFCNINNDPDAMINMMFGGSDGKKVKSILEKLPKKVKDKLPLTAVSAISGTIGINSAALWGTVPSEVYAEMREKYLMDESHNEFRAMVDKHQEAHKNLESLFRLQVERGAKIYSVCGYNKNMLGILASKDVNSDTIINLYSASAHAYSAKIGEKFPDDYVQQNLNCKNHEHNHISPERTVDASTCIFPETTWFFKNQIHDDIDYNDIAINLVGKIMKGEITDVHSDPNYPQFNTARYVKHMKKDLLPAYERADLSSTDPEDLKELNGAVDECRALLKETFGDQEKVDKATARLEAIERKLNLV